MKNVFKKMIIFSAVMFSLVNATVFAQVDYSNQWPEFVFPTSQPMGQVKTITETAFTMTADDDGIHRRIKYKLILSYNEENLLLSEEYFNVDGTSGDRIDYSYDNNGYLSLKTQSHPSVINSDREIFTLSKDGRILETEKIFSKGNYGWKYRNSYDNTGKIILTSKYDRFWKWKLVYSRMFEYNYNGRLSATEGFGMDYELLWRDEHHYDETGRLVETVKYNPEGGLVVRILNEFNEHGDYTRREFFDNNGNSYAVYTYGWSFDETGNWTSKIIGRELQGNRSDYIVPDSIINRDIVYYE